MTVQFHNPVRINASLRGADTFRARDNYSEDGTEVEAREVEIRGTSVWAKGPKVSKSGQVGRNTRTVLIEVDDLPHDLLVRLVKFLIDQDDAG